MRMVPNIALFCGAVALATLSTASLAEPVVFWASDPVEPDETVLIAGSDLSKLGDLTVQRLVDDQDGLTPATARAVAPEVLASSDTMLKFVVPPSLGGGIFSLKASGGPAAPVVTLNAPTIYWAQADRGDTATPGGWLRLFGRNISLAPGTVLVLRRAGLPDVRLAPASSNRWDATFALPAGIMPASYDLWLWNGRGDRTTWRSAGAMRIEAAAAPNQRNLDARGTGAIGDGVTDNAPALQRALDTMRDAGGGTVYLRRGFYRLNAALTIPNGVRLRGESTDSTNLIFQDFDKPPPELISGQADFSIEDLTIVASRHFHIIAGGMPRTAQESDGRNIALRRVQIRASAFLGHLSPDEAAARMKAILGFAPNGVDAIRLAGSNLVIEDCQIHSSSRALYLLRPHNARITGSTFSNGRMGWYTISGGSKVIFERNRVFGADLQATGGGMNTLFGSAAASENIFFSDNDFHDFSGWDREAVGSDGPGGFYAGRVSAEGSTLKMLGATATGSESRDWSGAGVLFLSGRGKGQFARVRSRDGGSVTLRDPLPVTPDESSLVTIVAMQLHYIIVNNRIADASVAVQLFGTSVDHVIAGNIADRTWGYWNRALEYRHIQPSWYNQFLENEIRAPDYRMPSQIAVWGQHGQGPDILFNYAAVVRNNRLGPHSGIQLRGFSKTSPGVTDALIEKNRISDPAQGVRIEEGVLNTLMRQNGAR